MFDNVFSEKWSILELQNVMMISKLYEEKLTPRRYRVAKFIQTKKNTIVEITVFTRINSCLFPCRGLIQTWHPVCMQLCTS
mgnify:CR=1 FL=1